MENYRWVGQEVKAPSLDILCFGAGWAPWVKAQGKRKRE